jgi:pimeloyl-ACP methyl ester carboxylesterase
MTTARRGALWLLGAAAVLVAAGSGLACSSLSKAELERRLLTLPKNASLAANGLATATLSLPGHGDGLDVVYAHVPRRSDAATTSSTPVVLVHGTPSSLFTWVDVIHGVDGHAGLAEDHDVYALDVVGHGLTRPDLAPYSFQLCADWVAAFIAGLGRGPVHLVGNSYGGEFAWRAAVDNPELVASLTLIDSSGLRREDDDWLPEEQTMRSLPGARFGYVLNSRERVATALQPHFREPLPADRLEEIFLLCDNADNWRAMVELARDENGDRQEDLARLDVPTLLLWGEQDLAYPPERYARRFAETIPGALAVLVPDCGHYPQEERPAVVIDRLRAFFAETDDRAEDRR